MDYHQRRSRVAGCRHLVALGGTVGLHLPADHRCEAFLRTCQSENIDGRVFYANEEQFNDQRYEEWIEGIIKENADVDGIFATSDVMAAQVIRVCRRLKLRVPEDVSVIGFDDTFIADLTCPSLTTVHQPIEQMCDYAVDAIVRKLKGDMIPTKIMLPVRLVERESVRGEPL